MPRTLAVVRTGTPAGLAAPPAGVEPDRVFEIGGFGPVALGRRHGSGDDGWVVWGAVPTASLTSPGVPTTGRSPFGLAAVRRGLILRVAGSAGRVDQPGRRGLRGSLAVGRDSARVRAAAAGRLWWLRGHGLATSQVSRVDGTRVLTGRARGLRWDGGDELDLAVAVLLATGISAEVVTFFAKWLNT